MFGKVETVRLIQAPGGLVGKGFATSPTEEQVGTSAAGRNLYHAAMVPLSDRCGVEVCKPGPVGAYPVFRVADHLPTGVYVPKGVKEEHGQVASAKGCPPVRQVPLVSEMGEETLADGLGKGGDLKGCLLLLRAILVQAYENGLLHFQVGGEVLLGLRSAYSPVDRGTIGSKKPVL